MKQEIARICKDKKVLHHELTNTAFVSSGQSQAYLFVGQQKVIVHILHSMDRDSRLFDRLIWATLVIVGAIVLVTLAGVAVLAVSHGVYSNYTEGVIYNCVLVCVSAFVLLGTGFIVTSCFTEGAVPKPTAPAV